MTFLQALLLAAMMAIAHGIYYFLEVTGLSQKEAELLRYQCIDRAFFQAVAVLVASLFF
ncbi:MAG: hypothetical protein NUV84_01340 [Candidatus Uhrbacteria bacterium]|nr:hypothetical protein [Candidatus Uhrbacteria bacterium]